MPLSSEQAHATAGGRSWSANGAGCVDLRAIAGRPEQDGMAEIAHMRVQPKRRVTRGDTITAAAVTPEG